MSISFYPSAPSARADFAGCISVYGGLVSKNFSSFRGGRDAWKTGSQTSNRSFKHLAGFASLSAPCGFNGVDGPCFFCNFQKLAIWHASWPASRLVVRTLRCGRHTQANLWLQKWD